MILTDSALYYIIYPCGAIASRHTRHIYALIHGLKLVGLLFRPMSSLEHTGEAAGDLAYLLSDGTW